MKRIEKIQFIGMGALGIMFGDFLAGKMGAGAVAFVGDKRRTERFEKEGAYCNEKPCSFSMIEAGKQEVADLLVFAVKGTALSEAVELAKDSVGEDTTIISLLNGISSEEVLSEAFGEEHIVYTVAQGMDATREGTHLIYSHMGELRIGVPKGEGAARQKQRQHLQRICQLFDGVQFPYTKEDDILRRIWSKWMLNIGCNPTAMILEGTFGTLQTGGSGHQLAVEAMSEVIPVANAEGVDLNETDLQEYINLLDSLNPQGMPSMRQDGLAKRYSEVELFNGALIAKARKHGIAVPTTEMVYQRVKEIEAGYEK
ncbi:ketopantoate reductase family protein [Emergencia sp. 1XD21-10]|jgi:2-dehydropantoate 2-reductase|uniref:ketopantoate reductase family protein n=1 Tax=Emergencia sp. 1XD21-10 TaxID=2304569 RepID=UPI001379CD17|nr:2-dehydropantoate 2-reductase [Emergencia sp. 1XD21-10]NCE98668.1 2-dehydropantoate 2-reductase [Emergencia sp. 1XD21-10]